MNLNVQLDSAEAWGTRLGTLKTTMAQVWQASADAAVQAVVHYYQHSYDVSRCQELYEILKTGGMGTIVNSYQTFLRRCTGITGIGGSKDWKHSKHKLAEVEPSAESVIQSVINAGLRQFQPEPPKKGEKSGSKARVIKLDESVTDEAEAALQRQLDGMSPEEITILAVNLNSIKAHSGPEFDDVDVQKAFEEVVELMHEVLSCEGEVPRPKGEGTETSKD